MKIFALGDLHLGFGVNKPMSIFGGAWENHSQRIESAWHQKVTSNDLVLIPGDISWATHIKEAKVDLEWLDALPGNKVCIKGNHDYWWAKPQKLNQSYPSIAFLQNTAYLVDKLAICGTRGWLSPWAEGFTKEDERIYRRELIRLGLSLEEAMRQKAQEIWVMLHYPPVYPEETLSPLVQLISTYPVTKVIYGHLHDETSWKQAVTGMHEGISYHLASSDYLGFSPLLLKEYNEKMESEE